MNKNWTVGVDFGATNIKVGAVSDDFKVLKEIVLRAKEHPTPQKFIQGLKKTLLELSSGLGLSLARLRGLGAGIPGLTDSARGVTHRLVNMPGGWRNVPLRSLMERGLGIKCEIDNDVNVVALGEWKLGAGRGSADSFYVTLGTGVGGAIVANGALIRGACGVAGEIGHLIIRPDGPRCGCGSRGCLEAFIGTHALNRKAAHLLKKSTVLSKLVRDGKKISPWLLGVAADKNDKVCKQIWKEFGEDLGLALSGMVNVLNPELIVIGGGLANSWKHFSPSLLRSIREIPFEASSRACKVVRAKLGDKAGILGGALLVREKGGNLR
jgi:glucokinase